MHPPAGAHVARPGSEAMAVGAAVLDCVGGGVAGVGVGVGEDGEETAAVAKDVLGTEADPVPTRFAAVTVQV